MIKAIAVDMDGTFLDSKKQYDQERFNRIFQQLKNENIKFCKDAISFNCR